MAFADKFKQIFAKKISKNSLSIALQQSSLSYCFYPEKGVPILKRLDAINGDHVSACQQLHKDSELKAACQLVLSANHYQIVQVDRPSVPEEELNAALKWQVKDLVTIAPEDMTVDYFDGPSIAGIEKVNVVCAQTSKLKNYVQAIHKDNLHLTKITTEEFTFAEFVRDKQGPQLLVCQQPNEEVLILIVQNGVLYSYRRLRGMAAIGQRTEQELAMGIIDNLSVEIQKSVDFFERQLKQPPVKQINVLLPVESEAFIARKLTENTHIPVDLLSISDIYPNDRKAALAIGNMMATIFEQNAGNASQLSSAEVSG